MGGTERIAWLIKYFLWVEMYPFISIVLLVVNSSGADHYNFEVQQ